MIPALRSLFYKIRKSRAAAPCQAPHSTMRTFASCPRRRVNRSSHPSIPPVSPTTFLVNTPLSFPLSLLSPIRPSSFPYLFFSLSLLSSIRPAPFPYLFYRQYAPLLSSSLLSPQVCSPRLRFKKILPPIRPYRQTIRRPLNAFHDFPQSSPARFLKKFCVFRSHGDKKPAFYSGRILSF